MKKIVLVAAAIWAAAVSAIPLPEHPRPDWQRDNWLNLNGEWQFAFDANKSPSAQTDCPKAFPLTITVPFGWGAPLSGVKNEGDVGWYKRMVKVPEAWKGKRIFVVVGASDHTTRGWFDDEWLGEHEGGYTPFEFELTDFVKWGEEQPLVFRVWDEPSVSARSANHLYGKQGYGNVRGIWQTVYLEARGDNYLESVRFEPDIKDGAVTAKVQLAAPAKVETEFVLEFKEEDRAKPASIKIEPGAMSASLKVKLRNVKLWDLDNPYLYEVKARLGKEDSVSTYFGMRNIGVGKMPGTGFPYVTLNGKPIYLQLTLDQSYHEGGYYTFPSDEFMKNEILISKQLGLSGNRVHIKVEVPRKLYWADKLGLLIMADVPNAWGPASEAFFREHRECFEGMVKRDFNHPCIFSWVLFNETWGLFVNGENWGNDRARRYAPWVRQQVAQAYQRAKMLDPTRMVEDNSPCNNDHVVTDINTWHSYTAGYNWERIVRDRCINTFVGSKNNYVGGFVQGNEPMFNSECGNVWGYKGSTGDVDWSWDYHMMMNAFRRHLQCSGWLYTEHHDVCNEWNGYVRFDRTWKETGLDELMPGMTLNDLHAKAYLVLDTELCREFKPNEVYTVPVDASFVTDEYAGHTLRLEYEIRWHDARGVLHSQPAQDGIQFTASSWQTNRIAAVGVKLPATTACGVVCFTLKDADKVIARNFTCFVVRGEKMGVEGTLTDAKWSVKKWNAMDGKKLNGAGKGYFEYTFDCGDKVVKTFRAEISTKRLNMKDSTGIDKGTRDLDCMLGGGFADRSKNPNSYPMTSVDKFAGEVKVIVNGVEVKRIVLPDDPADHRGILSWFAQKKDGTLSEAGSYGYLVEVEIPTEVAVKNKNGKLTVRLETEKNGLAIYGAECGRYPFSPTIEF